jgi:hypothetical protein
VITCMLRVANSTPMVDFDSRLNSLRVNLQATQFKPVQIAHNENTTNLGSKGESSKAARVCVPDSSRHSQAVQVQAGSHAGSQRYNSQLAAVG